MADLTAMMQAAAGAGGDQATFIEDVFSTYLYTGNGSTQTITNGIDLAGEGGLTWIKCRDQARDNCLFDTVRGATKFVQSNNTDSEVTSATSLTAFNSNGFSLGSNATQNTSTDTFCSWTFRKQPKFFDVVTYTGDGTGPSRAISHNLGSVPGMIILKSTSNATNWFVYHRSLSSPNDSYLNLNASNASANAGSNVWDVTSTTFSPGLGNTNGRTYVAYLFAHDDGGFGTAGTDNVISCGTFTGSGGSATVNLGYEPQFILYKGISGAGGTDAWIMLDSMRGIPTGSNSATLFPNFSNAENSGSNRGTLTATGFIANDVSASPYIYMAIRRPMKVPTTGTSVFGLNARTGTGANATVTGSAGVSDAVLVKNRGAVASLFSSRLTGTGYLVTSTTAVEVAAGTTILQANPWDVMDGVKIGTNSTITNASANTYINYLFRRAPGFMDVVCYTGTGSNRTVAHNLTVVPELMIVKRRSTTEDWAVYHSAVGNTSRVELNTTSALTTSINNWNDTSPTSSVFTVGISIIVNGSGNTYVAYLFATLAGVSKVGSYTGTAAAQTINCGFTGGARFVMIKRTDSTGDWYVWDTARGIISGDDPYWLTNSDAAEVTNTDYIDPASSGFEISSTAPDAINASGGSFIFLAIA